MLERAGWRCERCGAAGRLEVHHRKAIAHGGERFDPANLEVVCRRCHFHEHAGPVDPARAEWRALIDGVQ